MPFVVPVLAIHVLARVRLPFGTRHPMSRQVLVQSRVILDEMRIVNQPWIFHELLSDFRMRVHVPIGRGKRLYAVSIMLIPPFAIHEAIGMLLQLGTHLRMVLEITVESRMSRKEPRIVDELRIV